MTDIVQTTKNKVYKYIKSLQQKKVRTSCGEYTVEGLKSVFDATAAGCDISMIAMSKTFFKSRAYENPSCRIIVIEDDIFPPLCDTKNPQGIMAVIKMPFRNLAYDNQKLYVYCDNVSDPGNLGTIIRTADAAGFSGVLLSPGCVDLYNPKTVRSSMGSFFNIDVVPNFDYGKLLQMKNDGFSLFCGALKDDSDDFSQQDYTNPSVIVVGNEANGVSDEILDICRHIIIPIYGKAESLNAAIAGALMMYEAARQRRKLL